MSNQKQRETQRVLSRAGARILTREEITRISGARNETFVFTHVDLGDVTRD